jgi:predicted negative regulator of RcsB-dependent stress response
LTRHELKEQLQHDAFADNVSGVISYASSHREKLTRWAIVAGVVLIVGGIVFWYTSYQREQRRNDLQAAFAVYEAPVGTAVVGKTFPNQDEKNKASLKAFSEVAAKDNGHEEGSIARYYVGVLKAQTGDSKGAETDLRAVASSGGEISALAKIGLSQLLSGQNRNSEAQALLREVVNKPTDLVSKTQAQLLLAQSLESSNPAEAKKLLQSVKASNPSPAVTRALDQVASQNK